MAVQQSSPPTRVAVLNLHPGVNEDELRAAFRPCSPSLTVRIQRHPVTGHSLGSGVLEFPQNNDVLYSVLHPTYSRQRLKGMQIECCEISKQACLTIKNLPTTMPVDALQDAMEKVVGPLVHFEPVLGEPPAHTTGTCYVYFANPTMAQTGARMLSANPIGGQLPIIETPTAPPRAHITSHTLWVGNLAPKVTQDILDALFSQFGVIESVWLNLDKHGKHRGSGFVRYEDPADATLALTYANDILLFDSHLSVRQGYDVPKVPFEDLELPPMPSIHPDGLPYSARSHTVASTTVPSGPRSSSLRSSRPAANSVSSSSSSAAVPSHSFNLSNDPNVLLANALLAQFSGSATDTSLQDLLLSTIQASLGTSPAISVPTVSSAPPQTQTSSSTSFIESQLQMLLPQLETLNPSELAELQTLIETNPEFLHQFFSAITQGEPIPSAPSSSTPEPQTSKPKPMLSSHEMPSLGDLQSNPQILAALPMKTQSALVNYATLTPSKPPTQADSDAAEVFVSALKMVSGARLVKSSPQNGDTSERNNKNFAEDEISAILQSLDPQTIATLLAGMPETPNDIASKSQEDILAFIQANSEQLTSHLQTHFS